MAEIRIFTSNKLERLADALAETIKESPLSPFASETVVVQSRGMERWLAMELSLRLGICAGLAFPFPNAFIESLYRAVLPYSRTPDPFDPEPLTWRIMDILPRHITEPAFRAPAEFLRSDFGGLRLYQLSRRIAILFDKYSVFRPEMVLCWDEGAEDHWQAALWRYLSEETGKGLHKAAKAEAFIKEIAHGAADSAGFPERVALFGISTLPPLYLRILQAVSVKTQVNVFLMSPCREYWGDILSQEESAMLMRRKRRGPNGLHLGQGNSILASTGSLGREFLDLIIDVAHTETDLYEEPDGDSMLSMIQKDILHLKEPLSVRHVRDDDRSVQVHACHGPMREMEVLQDLILGMLDQDCGLSPADILVMTPDIDTYAPFIHAVFDLPAHDPRRIPYRVADRGSRKQLQVIETFTRLLDLAHARHRAPAVMEILRSPMVSSRYRLTEDDLELMEKWISESGIRWALDEQAKQDMNLPPFPENTWKSGLDRILLGYALPAKGQGLFMGIAPYDHVEGSDSRILAALLEFIDGLKNISDHLKGAHTPQEWSAILLSALELLFGKEADPAIDFLRQAVLRLGKLQEEVSFNGDVELSVIREYLKESLQGRAMGVGFLEGGVTFCAMVPMRSIPKKVICLLGINNDSFPGKSVHVDFDLTLSSPRRGDRSRRKDDRYLFLEALLSARKVFCVTYVGQDIRDNSRIPPATPVSDLLDYITRAFFPEKPGLEGVWHFHRLQSFSPAYFTAPRPISYSKDNFLAAQALIEGGVKTSNFLMDPLPPLSNGFFNTVSMEDLLYFFSNPSRLLLRKRLAILLEEPEQPLDDTELFDLTGLERHRRAEEILSWVMKGKNPMDLYPIMKASGGLPHGIPGEMVFENLLEDIKELASVAAALCSKPKRDSLSFSLRPGGVLYHGRVKNLYGSSLVRLRYGRIRGRDLLTLWIELVSANLASGKEEKFDAIIASWDKEPSLIRLLPPRRGEKIVCDLLDIYRQGLERPLKFFPETSWEYAKKVLVDGRDPRKALRAVVNNIWENDFKKSPERADPYITLCFGEKPELDEDFQRYAVKIYGPVIQAMEQQ